jgi:hypothetical protein
MEFIKQAIKRTGRELPGRLNYKESHFQKVLEHYIRKLAPNCVVSKEVNLPFKTSDGFAFASGRMDLVVETKSEYIILELKVYVSLLKGEQKQCIAQLQRYMTNAETEKKMIGILVVFGRHKPMIRVIHRQRIRQWKRQ